MKKSKVEIRGAYAKGEVGKTYRLLFKYKNSLKLLAKLKILSDGTILVFDSIPFRKNYSFKKISGARKGHKTIKVKDIPQEQYGTSDNPGKMTFHPSGAINVSDKKRLVRDSLRTVDITQQLLTYIFPHVELLKSVSSTKKFDIVLEAPIEKDVHLQLSLLVSPPSGNIMSRFLSPNTIGFVELDFKHDGIQHSGRQIIIQAILGKATRDKIARANVTLVITLSDEVAPQKLKPKKQI